MKRITFLSSGFGLSILAIAALLTGCAGQEEDSGTARAVEQSLSGERCQAAEPAVPAVLLERAVDVVGFTRKADRVLHFQAVESVVQDYQSERPYPPFFHAMRTTETWLAPATGVERIVSEFLFPGFGPNPTPTVLRNQDGVFMVRGDEIVPAPPGLGGGIAYPLNPWAVLQEWSKGSPVRVAEQCLYRDYWRVVLARPGRHGEERLYLDSKTSFPVKLDRWEPHYLWGQVHVEYLYSLWGDFEGAYFPRTSFRLVDGRTEIQRTVGKTALLSPDEAPPLDLPSAASPSGDPRPRFLQPIPPETVPIGPQAYLLVNPGYTEAVALVNGTVFVFDATQGEERARLDAERIEELFPGDHPVVVVVTDLAWPHIAGIRYWVAEGATIVSHRISEDFLRKVVDRRWTLEPDLLEDRRDQVSFQFVGLDSLQTLAGGGVALMPIDGIGSEGALIAYLPGLHFLWAGDFIQSADRPTAYATEVRQAVHRAGWQPGQTAAQHLPFTDWSTLESLQHGGGA